MATGDDLKGELGNYSLPLSQNENVKADCSFRTSELKVTPPGANIKLVLLYRASDRRQGIQKVLGSQLRKKNRKFKLKEPFI